nr:MAG TPA: hypothetical protein [Caudoviricetes sp.]
MKREFMCDFKTGQKVITPSGRLPPHLLKKVS